MLRLYKINDGCDTLKSNKKKGNLKRKKSIRRKGRKRNKSRKSRSRSRSRSRSKRRKSRGRKKKRKSRSYRKRRGGSLAGQQPFGFNSEPASVSGMSYTSPSVGDISNPYYAFSSSKLSPMESGLAAGQGHVNKMDHGSFFKHT